MQDELSATSSMDAVHPEIFGFNILRLQLGSIVADVDA
jgi:hypothetical protein